MNLIRKIRIEKGFTQDSLANKIGVDRSTVAKWEANKSTPEIKRLKKLAEIFGCTIDELVR